jgi:hypothetical protein
MKRIFSFCLLFILLSDSSFGGVSVIGGLTRERVLQPGEKYEGKITLQNSGETSWQVTVYKTDYLYYADGRNIYGEPGQATRSNADWITVSPPRLIIPPNEQASLYYKVEVPQNPNLIGTYWSMIMIEPASEASLKNLQDKEGKVKVGIQTVVRYGIQIVTHIGDSGTCEIDFMDKKLIKAEGQSILQMDIENIGQRWLSPIVWVELYSSQGSKVGRFESDKKRIYPECSVRHRIDLTEVPTGNYKALVIVDNGDDNVFGARYNLGIE